MTWDDFLEYNQYSMDYDEWEALDDEDKVFMSDTIDGFKSLLETNQEEPEEIRYIEQELPGDPFEAWTKLRVYFSDYNDWDEMIVRSAFRHPPYAVVR